MVWMFDGDIELDHKVKGQMILVSFFSFLSYDMLLVAYLISGYVSVFNSITYFKTYKFL